MANLYGFRLYPTFSIELGLQWISEAVLTQSNFIYTDPVGGFVNNDETEYDAITWSDIRTKPLWTDVVSAYTAYNNFMYKTLPVDFGLFNTVVQAMLDSKLTTADLATEMAPHISGAVSTAVSGLSLGISDITGLSTALSGKSSFAHDHIQSEITDLSTDLSNKVDKIVGKGLSTEDYSSAEKTKLSGIASGATVNSSDATLLARANHTGNQAISTVTSLQTTLDDKVVKVSGKGLSTEDYSTAEKTKLSGIATAATANSTDAQLRDRTTHTGSQAISTVTGLQTALDSKLINLGSANQAVKTYTGTTDSSGNVVFHLTNDNLSTGTALFSAYGAAIPTAFDGSGVAIQSPNAFNVGWSNSSKTLTIRVNRGTTTSVLLGGTVVSDQFAGAGYTVELIVIGTKA